MSFSVKVKRSPHYVRFVVAGNASLKNFADLFGVVGQQVEQYEDVKALFDLRRVVGRLTSSEQMLLGEIVALKLPLLFKLASLVPVGEITRNSERAALSKGLAVRVFDSEPEALAWLLEGQAGEP
jgi:hypothetical protein